MHKYSRRLHVSKVGLFSVLAFILFSVFFRLLLPFGDEPDFTVKANAIKFNDSVSLIAILPEALVKSLRVSTNCVVDADPFSLISFIPHVGCSEPFYQVIVRLFATFFTFIPLFMVLVFKRNWISFLYSHASSDARKMANLRVDGMTVALPFSGFVYYAGLLSNEQLSLMLSALAFLFLDKILFLSVFMLAALYVDFGNAVVAIFFFLIYYGAKLLYIQFGRCTLYFVLVSIFAVISYFGFSVLTFLPGELGLISEKANAMLWVMTEGSQSDRIDKYPLIYRPILTGLSFVLYTPGYVKAPLAYLFLFFISMYLIVFRRKVQKKSILSFELNFQLLLLIFSIFTLTFAFPTYANGKYYVFMLPIIFSFFVLKLGRTRAMAMSVITTVLVVLNLSLFRLF